MYVFIRALQYSMPALGFQRVCGACMCLMLPLILSSASPLSELLNAGIESKWGTIMCECRVTQPWPLVRVEPTHRTHLDKGASSDLPTVALTMGIHRRQSATRACKSLSCFERECHAYLNT